MLERAFELGVRYFDTAPLYGRGTSETLFGEYLSGVPRGEFVVSSKVGRVANPEVGGPPLFDFSRDRVLSSLAESLERLRLDAIDMVFLHLLGDTPHHYRQALYEALPALAELRSQGVVRAIGVGTTTDTWEMLAPFAQDGGSDCFLVANRYTLIDHSACPYLPRCGRNWPTATHSSTTRPARTCRAVGGTQDRRTHPATGAYSSQWRITMPHRLDNKVAARTTSESTVCAPASFIATGRRAGPVETIRSSQSPATARGSFQDDNNASPSFSRW